MCGRPNVPGCGRQLCPRARLRTALRAGRTESFGFRWLRTQETCFFFAASHPVQNDAHATGVGSTRAACCRRSVRVEGETDCESAIAFFVRRQHHATQGRSAHSSHTASSMHLAPSATYTLTTAPRRRSHGTQATGRDRPCERALPPSHQQSPERSIHQSTPNHTNNNNEASLMQSRGERPWHGGSSPHGHAQSPRPVTPRHLFTGERGGSCSHHRGGCGQGASGSSGQGRPSPDRGGRTPSRWCWSRSWRGGQACRGSGARRT